LILDLFCGLGGAARGYVDAGHTVVGVDHNPQPDYPYQFVMGDALDDWFYQSFDLIHASPPCQNQAAITKGTNSARRHLHRDLYPAVQRRLHNSGLPYVIENPAARPDLILCGETFGLGVIRHRRFELGRLTIPQPDHRPHRGRVRGWRHGQYFDGPYVAVYGNGGGKATVPEIQNAMGIDWSTNRAQLIEAIPPAYTHYIGTHL
jgi:DNA (cytosine-5)-methyltransferase 1